MLNSLLELAKIQSIWYDNIERRILKNGELKQLIADGISGVTSNPAIFEKAILSSGDYDADITRLAKAGKTAEEIYTELTLADIAQAADILMPVFDKSNREDGYVSIEVSPEYAYDADKTIDSGRNLFGRLGRPNVMIKVPATAACIPAIRQLISDGINVNATLIFSMAHYQAVANAYIAGLAQRLKSGRPINTVFSVASVFISRLDTRIDTLTKDESLKGKAAVAHTKQVYQMYRAIFYGPQSDSAVPAGRQGVPTHSGTFAPLGKAGAHRQRILWASTSSKNPAYSDIKYVQEIIAPDSINTIPPATIKAFKDHGKPQVTIDQDLAGAEKALQCLGQQNIDTAKVCQDIQDEGVKSFAESYNKTIAAIKTKMEIK